MPPGGEALARTFYVTLLGLSEVPRPEAIQDRGGVWFTADGLDIHVVAEVEERSNDTRRHFGLECEDVDGLRARLDAAGITTETGRPAPWRRFFTRDPFGNRIEVHEVGGLRA